MILAQNINRRRFPQKGLGDQGKGENNAPEAEQQ
jgi:hypothetical protein